MGLKEFNIFISQPQFYAGQELAGNVKVCVTQEPLIAKSIVLTIQGNSSVRWEETRDHSWMDTNQVIHSNIVTDVYESHVDILTDVQQLWKSDKEENFPVGEFSFPFRYTFPRKIPSSFKSSLGNVCYTIQAKMKVPKQSVNIEHSLPITVVRPWDFVFDAAILEPMTESVEHTFCCLWCSSGPVTLVLSLPTTLVTPGEKCLPTVEVDNASRVNITRVTLTLSETTKYIAQRSATRYESTTICRKKLGTVDAHQAFTWVCSDMQVPPNLTNLTGCTNISVSYYLEVECEAEGCHCPLAITVPMQVGRPPQNSSTPTTLIKSKVTEVSQQGLRQRKH